MSDGQEPLFPAGKPVTPLRPLTARQMAIYTWICEQPAGITALELGQHLHGQKLKHHETEVCVDCGRDGGRAMREKAIRKRLIRHHGSDVYAPRNEADWTGRAEPVGPPSAQLAALPGETFEDMFQRPDAA